MASATNSTVTGGQNNTASGLSSTIVGGQNNTAAGDYSTVFGGHLSETVAGASFSAVSGRQAKAYLYGSHAQASGQFAAPGDAQAMRLVLRRQTTDATVTALKLDGSGADMMPTTHATWAVTGTVAAHRVDVAGDSAAYEVKFCCRRGTGAAALVGTPTVTPIGETAGAAAWDVAVVADGGSGTIRINVVGEAGKTIRWVGSLNITQAAG